MADKEQEKIVLSKKSTTPLEKIKMSSMGPDTILIIPRSLVKYNIIDPDYIYNVYFEKTKEKKK